MKKSGLDYYATVWNFVTSCSLLQLFNTETKQAEERQKHARFISPITVTISN